MALLRYRQLLRLQKPRKDQRRPASARLVWVSRTDQTLSQRHRPGDERIPSLTLSATTGLILTKRSIRLGLYVESLLLMRAAAVRTRKWLLEVWQASSAFETLDILPADARLEMPGD